jgi:hypothetical protein
MDSTFIMYTNQAPNGEDFFEVQCGLGGVFEPPTGWPLCNSITPQKCDLYPEPPDIVELVAEEPQLPGGKIRYKCKEEGFSSNLGGESGEVEVSGLL